jgi:hypothetical protein
MTKKDIPTSPHEKDKLLTKYQQVKFNNILKGKKYCDQMLFTSGLQGWLNIKKKKINESPY